MAARHWITAMMLVAHVAIYAMRAVLPLIIPLMTTNDGTPLTLYQRASLLTSFYAGYVPFQIVAAGVTAGVGGHPAVTTCLLGAGLLALVPVTLSRSYWGTCMLLALSGLLQAPYVAATNQIQSRWFPKGETAKLKATTSLGSRCSRIVTFAGTPVLCRLIGWHAPCYLVGVVSLVAALTWHFIGSSTPADCRFISDPEREMICQTCAAAGAPPPARGGTAGGDGTQPSRFKSTVAHMGTILGSTSSRAIIVAHFACNWNAATVDTYLPQFYQSKFGATAETAGFITAAIKAGEPMYPFGLLWANEVLLKGWSPTAVRKMATGGGLAVTAVALLGLALGDSLAAAVFCHGLASVANSLHALGFIVGQLEVGGANAGILAGISNQIANVAGAVLPMIAAALRLHTGGLEAVFGCGAVLIAGCGLYYVQNASTWPLFGHGKKAV